MATLSGIVGFSGDSSRNARIHAPHGDTSLMFPRMLIPQLGGKIEPGITVLKCGVFAHPDGKIAEQKWKNIPKEPNVEELDELFQQRDAQVEDNEAASLKAEEKN